jgi:predicted regulator of Ras-like GTPase activity (Roadblock/LC7/MglB family)
VIDEALRAVLREGRGVEVVLLTGIDGVVVASTGSGAGLSTEAVAAAFADLLRKTGGAHREAGLPDPQELTAGSPGRRVVVRAVTAEYFLLAVLGETGIVGQARHVLSQAAARLEPELL